MAAQEALKPWLQLAELTGQPGEVAALLQQQLRAHKAKLAAPTEPEPEPELEQQPEAEAAAREAISLGWTGPLPSRQFKGWAAGAGMVDSEVPLGDKELDDLLARAANLRGRDVGRTLATLEIARKQLAAKDPRTTPTVRRQLGRVWKALALVTAEVPVLRVRMLVGLAEWCEGEEPVGMGDLETMAAWAAAGTAADEDGEFATSLKVWNKLLPHLPEASQRRPLPLLGTQLVFSQAMVGRSAAHLRSGEHAQAICLLRRNVDDWRQRLHGWEASACGRSSMESADISEGVVARDELAKAMLCLADALDPDISVAPVGGDPEKQASAEEAAVLQAGAKSCDVSSAHHLFGRVRSSLGSQYWGNDGEMRSDATYSDSDGLGGGADSGADSSQWSFEGSRNVSFPQSLPRQNAAGGAQSMHRHRTTQVRTTLANARTYPRVGLALRPQSSQSFSGISGISEVPRRDASVSASSRSSLPSNEEGLTSKSPSRAKVASELAQLYKQPGFESPMPLWFRGLTANLSDTRGSLDVAYRQFVGPLDGDGRIMGVPGLAAATGAKGALQKRRLILAKMEMQPEIVQTLMAIAGYDPTRLD